jgi:hypothetical protein
MNTTKRIGTGWWLTIDALMIVMSLTIMLTVIWLSEYRPGRLDSMSPLRSCPSVGDSEPPTQCPNFRWADIGSLRLRGA